MVSGCGAQGHPVAGEIDVRTLDVGNYPVNGFHYDQDAQGHGALLEGMRMSAALVPSVRIDPSLNIGFTPTVHTKDQLDDVVKVDGLAGVSIPVLQNRGFLVDYSAGGSDRPESDVSQPNSNGVTMVLLRFPTTDAATLASHELEDADYSVARQQNQRLSIDAYPDALIHWRPGVNNIGAWMARKDFVLTLFVSTLSADQQTLLSMVRKTLDAEVPAIDAFQETPTDKLDSLRVDPDNLLARTVVAQRNPARAPDPSNFAVYHANDFVDDSQDEATRQQLVDTGKVDEVGVVDNDVLLRTGDQAASVALVSDLVGHLGDSYVAAAAPPKVPDAKCVQNTGGSATAYRCYVAYKRYVAVLNSTTASDAQQQAAAEYALLANSM
ncbi:hypothetical protein ACIP5Y_13915 [Nocardia sp. NPDC088792]|uniref:DUF7373 family lipoprotein n=1 Tax=Nocardia sp. NPDC088792 TaxID=3364332 RepID=UPI0037FCE96B